MKKIWKDIPGYETLYKVSNYGEVLSIKRNIILIPHVNASGYLAITLCKNNIRNTRTIHRIVATAFFGKSDLTVNHLNGIKTDNKVTNLEYCTRSENNSHAYRIGLHDSKNKKLSKKMKKALSEDSPRAKLKEKDVLEIRKLRKEGYKNNDLAKMYNVHPVTISLIITNKNWNKLKEKRNE